MRWFAIISGVIGLLADVLLVLFYVVAQPWTDTPRDTWLGFANDCLVIVQYAALLPVVFLLSTRRVWTIVGAVAAATVVVFQLLLVTGAMPFDTQVGFVSAASIASMLWAGFAGLPLGGVVRTLSRILLIGLPVALAAFLAGTLVTMVSDVSWAWVAGGAVGAALWFVFPTWALVLGLTAAAPSPHPAPSTPSAPSSPPAPSAPSAPSAPAGPSAPSALDQGSRSNHGP
ncbi:MAG: hypothetical protein HOV71_27130 [Hamadaea sp.]|nr:hypothetical protein [Hamadaea sp.]